MVNLERFDEVESRIEKEKFELETESEKLMVEASKKSRLSETARRIKKNIEATRNYDPTIHEVYLKASNEKTDFDHISPHKFARFLRLREDPLVLGFFEAQEDRADIFYRHEEIREAERLKNKPYQTVWPDFISPSYQGGFGEILGKLFHREMTEQEYFDYLEGLKPIAVFDAERYTDDAHKLKMEKFIGGAGTSVLRKPKDRETHRIELYIGTNVNLLKKSLEERLDALSV